MRSLQTLKVDLALEALHKVEELVRSQGGSCRNLSSILQSVCRKLERRRPTGVNQERRPAQIAENVSGTSGDRLPPAGNAGAAQEQRQARCAAGSGAATDMQADGE